MDLGAKANQASQASQAGTGGRKSGNEKDFWLSVEHECQAMVKHAFAKGVKVPAKITKLLAQQKLNPQGDDRAEQLTQIHNQLAELVSPAKPVTIMLMAKETEKASLFLFFGRVPLIRKMMMVAILSLVVLIALSLSSYINNENMVTSMFDMEGTRLLFVQAILLASAAIGASFAALFKANSYVTAGCYDPKYESSYWVRFVVGLIAGIILTQLIPINLDTVARAAEGAMGSVSPDGQEEGSGVSHAALRISMALVGGFSANLVYTILDRTVETIASFVSPATSEDPEIQKQALLNQFGQEKIQLISELSAELSKIQQQVMADEDISQSRVQQLLSQYQLFLTSNERTL
ncbi:hypothetical protein SG34_024090 [Thalassomonas viridans]|uniref:Uncharacterized protein n=1 Tax=Thalassomonas viridans TaxID=137584 RepID=A0AAE9Z370_9GAMM|nr:hypothetical protein [Thalassomonas viridans]WDE04388.1 hypothetical protein SG34_024090 [Thalassomonas viridans]